MQDMPGPHDPRGFVVEWQLVDDAATGAAHGEIDLADRADQVVLTDDAQVRSGSGG